MLSITHHYWCRHSVTHRNLTQNGVSGYTEHGWLHCAFLLQKGGRGVPGYCQLLVPQHLWTNVSENSSKLPPLNWGS